MCRRWRILTALLCIFVICIFLLGEAAADGICSSRQSAVGMYDGDLPGGQTLSGDSMNLPSVDYSQAKKEIGLGEFRIKEQYCRVHLPLYLTLIITLYLSSWKFVKRVFFAFLETYACPLARFMRNVWIRYKKDGKKREFNFGLLQAGQDFKMILTGR